MKKNKSKIIVIWVVILLSIAISACGSSGEEGPVGAQGPAGPQGPSGPQGDNASASATYVGHEACATCHEENYTEFMNSGHPYKLNEVVNGQPPEYPFTEVPSPPEGYTWDDILYVIGGYNWKARFVDKQGYIITGDENATTQYNFYNRNLAMGNNWVGYHAGETEKPYNCGECHTTGYRPEGHQDGLPGLIGTWAEPGIMCEECHGPGSQHIKNPYGISMEVDRDAEACGACHRRDGVEEVNASGGFIKHHEQYEELFQSKHITLDCVICHDPHTGVVQLREANEETTRTSCENCHYKEAQNQAVERHSMFKIDCIECHMPRITKSALGDAEIFTGDIRTHIMAIDPLQIGQFNEEGTVSNSQISLDFACRQCHVNGSGNEKADSELIDAAFGYHDLVIIAPAE